MSKVRDYDCDKKQTSPLIVYGAGHDGENIDRGLIKKNIDFTFCDENCPAEFLLGKKVIRPYNLEEYKTADIIIGSSKYAKDI